MSGDRRSASLFHSFFNHAHIPLVVVDEDGLVVEANAAATEALGICADGRTGILDGFWRVSAAAVLRLLEAVRRQVPVKPIYGEEVSGISWFTAVVRVPLVLLRSYIMRRRRGARLRHALPEAARPETQE